MRIPFATQAYSARSKPLAAQRLVNLFAEAAPRDAKSDVVLYGTHGLGLFSTAGSGKIRGMHNMNGTLYVVSGTEFYSVNSAGTASQITGTIAGTGQVAMANNGTQIVIVNGTTTGYIYTVAGGLTTIADGDFQPADTVVFIDGYFIFNDSNSRGQFFISGSYDGTTYDPLEFATAEAAPDDCIAVVANHRELWLMGEETTEVWYNSGDPDFPFSRIGGAVLEKGCAAKFSPAILDNTVFWLGSDRVVYRANGYQPQRISTHAIEYAIEGYSDVSDAIGFAFYDEGHAFYVLTFPTGNATWVYDAATGLWHERATRDSVTGVNGRWRPNCFARCYSKNIVGDVNANGQVYTMDLDTYLDNSSEILRVAASPHTHADRADMFFHSFEVDMELGVGLVSGQGSDPQISLEWSDDGGHSWSNQYFRSFGTTGKRDQRVMWRRLGTAKQRAWRLQTSEPVKIAILGAHVEAERAG